MPKFDSLGRQLLISELAILDSMTPEERARPTLLCQSRVNRITMGCGVEPAMARGFLRAMSRDQR
ncbi:MAG: hypothetical protein AAGG48_32175 [Planctomycetota bacterium]